MWGSSIYKIRSDQFGINKTHFQMTFNHKMSYSEEILIEQTDDTNLKAT